MTTMIGTREFLKTYLPDMGSAVPLTPFEERIGRALGLDRQDDAVKEGREDAHDFEGDGEFIHIAGARGELALAKFLNVYFVPTINTFQKGGDVGRYQVRTRSELDHELLVRPNAKDDDIYVLVRGVSPNFMVVGWMRAGDAKRPEWFQPYGGRKPAYFVPDTFLHEMADLPK